MARIVGQTRAEHGNQHRKQPVADAAQGTPVAVSGVSAFLVMTSRLVVPLHAHASPAITGFAHALIAPSTHLNSLGLAALFRQGEQPPNKTAARHSPW